MSVESGWAAAVGIAVGMLGWVVGLGKLLWPEHPQWALSFIIVGVTLFCMVILERNDRHSTHRVQTR